MNGRCPFSASVKRFQQLLVSIAKHDPKIETKTIPPINPSSRWQDGKQTPKSLSTGKSVVVKIFPSAPCKAI